MLKIQAGAFDGRVARQHHRGKGSEQAGVRRARDAGFLGQGEGLHFNGTYYGDKDILALGVAAQSQDSKTTFTLDG